MKECEVYDRVAEGLDYSANKLKPFRCHVCTKLLCAPYKCKSKKCGFQICQPCIKKHLLKKCSKCNKELIRDKLKQKDILDLKTVCVICDFSSTFRVVLDHFKVCLQEHQLEQQAEQQVEQQVEQQTEQPEQQPEEQRPQQQSFNDDKIQPKKDATKFEKLLKSHLDLEKQLNELKIKILKAQEAVEKLERVTFDEYLWKISDIKRVNSEGQYFESEVFEIIPNGYNIQLHLLISQVGELVVGLTVIQGEFDDILTWPIKNNFQITILSHFHNSSESSYNRHLTKVIESSEYELQLQQPNKSRNSSCDLNFVNVLNMDKFFNGNCLYIRCRMIENDNITRE